MTDAPMPFEYCGDGTLKAQSPYFVRIADDRFTVGNRYMMTEHQERSFKSHSHYFASLHEAWMNLPERIAWEFPNDKALRKRALIMTGFRDERSFVCASKAETQRFAAFLKPMDDLAVVSIHECVVLVWTAKSQKMKAMGKADFQKSKDAVLEWAWDWVGVPAETGNANAGQAA